MATKYSWFGIDFGTTNSAACSFTGYNQETIVPICYGDDEQRPFPSVIAINKKQVKLSPEEKQKSEEMNSLVNTNIFLL